MTDPIIDGALIGIILAVYFTFHYLRAEDGIQQKVIREAQKRETESKYHAELANKYSATMTEADRGWFNSLPDWDRMPIFRSGK